MSGNAHALRRLLFPLFADPAPDSRLRAIPDPPPPAINDRGFATTRRQLSGERLGGVRERCKQACTARAEQSTSLLDRQALDTA